MQSDTLLMAVVIELLVLILLNVANKIQIPRSTKKKVEPPPAVPVVPKEHGEPHPIAREIIDLIASVEAKQEALERLLFTESNEIKQTLAKVLEVSGTQMKALQYLMDFVQQAQRPR